MIRAYFRQKLVQGKLKERDHEEQKPMKNSISARLAGLLVITFLPVNIFAIIASSVIINQVSGRVQDSYQRETDAAMNRLMTDLDQVEERFSDFLIEYMTELTLEESGNTMTTLQMLEDLYDVWDSVGRSGMTYLYDREEEKLYLRYTAGAYGVMRIEEAKKALEKECGIKDGGEESRLGSVTEWTFVPLSEGWFLSRRYEYINFDVGFLLDMEKYLDTLNASPLWSRNQVYLCSGSGIYSFRDGRIRQNAMTDWEDVFSKWYLGRSVKWAAEGMDLQMGIRVVDEEMRTGIPGLYWALLVVAVFTIFLTLRMWLGLKKRVVEALLVIKRGMQELEQEHLDYRISDWDERESEEFVFLYNSFNHMAEEISLSRKKDVKMYQTQLDNLRLQVNPHMLLNSFNMIYSLAQSRNFQCIQDYSLLLVDYFRYALKETDHFVPLEKEMEFVENYISIQKIRFPGAFTSVYRIAEDCRAALVPPLLIENFVENAMKYALVPGSIVEVLINIRQEDRHLLISICDTGRGIKPQILECLRQGAIYRDKMGREHIGVWNCRRRMEVFYGEAAFMDITSSLGQGTRVWLDVPFLTVTAEEFKTE